MTLYPIFPLATPVGSSGSSGGASGNFQTAFPPAVYFIDSSLGVDANDGLTPATALLTAAGLAAKSPPVGSFVYFKRGQRHSMASFSAMPANDITFDAYGSGAAPWLWRGNDAGPLGQNVVWTDLADGTGRYTASVIMENGSTKVATRCGFGSDLTIPLPKAAAAVDVGINIKGTVGVTWTQVGSINVWSRAISGLTSPGFVDLLSVNGAEPTRSEEYQSFVLPNQSWMYKSTNATSGTIYLYSTVDPATLATVQAGAGWHATTGSGGFSTMTIFSPHGSPNVVYATGIVYSATSSNEIITLGSTKTGCKFRNIDLCYGNSGLEITSTDCHTYNVNIYGHFTRGCQVSGDGPGVIFESTVFKRNGLLATQGNYGLKIGTGQEIIKYSELINCTFDQNGEDGFTEQCGTSSVVNHYGCLSKRNNENAIDCKQKGLHRIDRGRYISRNWLQGGAGVGAAAFQADVSAFITDSIFISATNAPGVQTNPRTQGRIDRTIMWTARGIAFGLGNDVGTLGAFDGYWLINASQFISTDRDAQASSLMAALKFEAGSCDIFQSIFSERGTGAGDLCVQLVPNTEVVSMLCRIYNSIFHSEAGAGASSHVLARSATSAQSTIKLQARNNIFWLPNVTTNWVLTQTTSGVQLSETQVNSGVTSVLNFDGGTTIHVAGATLTGTTSGAVGTITNFVTAGSSPNRAGTLYLSRTGTGTGAIPFLDNEAITDSGAGASIANGIENDSFILTNSIADPTVNPLFTNPWKGAANAEEEETGDYSIGSSVWIVPYDGQTANFSQGEKVLFQRAGVTVATGWIRNDYDAGATGVLCISSLSAALADNDTILGTLSGGLALVNDAGIVIVSVVRTLVNLSWSAQATVMVLGLLLTGGTSGHKGYLISQTPTAGTGRMTLAVAAGQTFANAETITDTGTGSRTVSGTAGQSPAKRVYAGTSPPVLTGIDLLPLDAAFVQGSATPKRLSFVGDGANFTITDENSRFVSSGFKIGDTIVAYDAGASWNSIALAVSGVTASALTGSTTINNTVSNSATAYIFKTAPVTAGAQAAV